ncbi:MAG: GmrSD restriction endonuclease domain-containing protein [Alphaproteobacteria bacterium]
MATERYSVNQYPVQTILSWIRSGEIAIPEIQRPFVWKPTQVRDFIDSLYNGYPVGYLIAWRNPTVRLKDGTSSQGKRILIDGQQRVTALLAALIGERVVNKKYRRVRIHIAFHPNEGRFEVANPAIRKDKAWLADIAEVLSPEAKILRLVDEYCANNVDADKEHIYDNIERMRAVVNNPIGLIELNSDLDIETVTEIFIRINSKGVPLDQADFVMSKIAANETYGGNLLRKSIDYFCHLAVAPEFYQHIADNDPEFGKTEHFRRMAWLRQEKDDLYDPSYRGMLRVAFTSEFKRGRLGDLVALLSGRNFETRTYEEEIAEASFAKLDHGVSQFMNETNFKRFVMIIRSAGFIDGSMIRSQNALNFADIVYLVLRAVGEDASRIESLVRRWFVMSVLTGRYSAAPETAFELDIRQIDRIGVADYLTDIEQAELSTAFWETGLPQSMGTPVASSPYFKVFLAAQVRMNDKGFLSRDITVRDLITHKGDVHHLFPRNYLKRHGLAQSRYNQIANYVMMQSELNIQIGDRPPAEYLGEAVRACQEGKARYGAICDAEELRGNLAAQCIPQEAQTMRVEDYDRFLLGRRQLMAAKIKAYYESL